MGYDMYVVDKSGNEDKDYFRANIWGMQILRAAMKAVDVLDLETEAPAFVKADGAEESEDDGEKWQEANAHVLAFSSPEPNKVPIVKFCSNDGWVVTAEECKIIGDALATIDKPIVYTDGWDNKEVSIFKDADDWQFIKNFGEFCLHASSHGGFTVW